MPTTILKMVVRLDVPRFLGQRVLSVPIYPHAPKFHLVPPIILTRTRIQMTGVKDRVVTCLMEIARHVSLLFKPVAKQLLARLVVRTTMEWLQMVVKALQSFVLLYQVDRALHALQLKPVDAPQWFAMQEKLTQTIILPMDAK